jgi:salicylate hydroxylase
MCIDEAESLADLPKVLKAFETIRKPRTEWLVRRGREMAKTFHLPDGPEQEQRDAFLGKEPLFSASSWDGKHIDDPPEGVFNRLTFVYMSGYDIMDYVSILSGSCKEFKRESD